MVLSQIMENNLIHNLSGDTVLSGISFREEQPFIVSKTITI